MAHVHERLTLHPHDRAAARRTDSAWLRARWADPATRVLLIAGTRLCPSGGRISWVSPGDAPEGTRILLGELDGVAYFAVVVPASTADEEWVPLRGVLPVLSAHSDGSDARPGEAALVLHAIGLAEWLWSTHFCARCGSAVHPEKEGHELRCENGHTTFPRTDPAVIMLITHGEPGSEDERCLLGHQAAWPAGRYSTLAGFCEPGESLEDAVRREVLEETSVEVGDLAYFGNQPWPLPASLMLGFTGRAISTEIVCDPAEVDDAQWFTRRELHDGAASGALALPSGVSISRSLIESWYGGSLPGSW